MKKSIFIGALALITLAACQNEREESTPKVDERSEMAINAVKLDSKDPSFAGKPTLPEASIECHTDYADDSGNACVFNGGYMFNVTWAIQNVYNSSTGQFYPTKVYTATSVHSCSCG